VPALRRTFELATAAPAIGKHRCRQIISGLIRSTSSKVKRPCQLTRDREPAEAHKRRVGLTDQDPSDRNSDRHSGGYRADIMEPRDVLLFIALEQPRRP
jgi:hypothetical protein